MLHMKKHHITKITSLTVIDEYFFFVAMDLFFRVVSIDKIVVVCVDRQGCAFPRS